MVGVNVGIVGVGVMVGCGVRVNVGARVGVLVGLAVFVPVGNAVGVAEGVIRLVGRSMRGATQTGLSASAGPSARTVKINLTFLPSNELRSRSTV